MAKKLWGGRFEKKTDSLAEEFTKSINYDYKLAEYDLGGSLFHVMLLEKSGYLTSQEASSLKEGLKSIVEDIKNGTFKVDDKCEDIHTYIQNILQEKLGDVALKLHMARSRNDQVVFATKVYCRLTMEKLGNEIAGLASEINTLVKNNDIVIPGFTHLQHAQPVYLKDYLGAYIEMLQMDRKRLKYIAENVTIAMGSGALAGTPISSEKYNITAQEVLKAETLKSFKEVFHVEPTINPLDSVSNRDFIIEIISALSLIAMHLSRLAEDLIIWSTKEFDFVEIDEAFCTGSSLMPQKKNPDVLELIRGYTGRLYGNLVSVLTTMKGLPLTYNRDMQLDKEPLFSSFEIVSKELKVLAGLIKTLKFNEDKIKESLEDESLYATDLVYYLVEKGEPFKNAHTIVGELVKYTIKNNTTIKKLPEDVLKEKFSAKFIKREIIKLFNPRISVESKKSIKR